QHTDDQLYRQALAIQERAMGLQKVALTRAAIQLAPRAAAGMAIRADVAEPEPAAIVTAGMGAEVHRGVHGTRASLGRRHGGGSAWRLRLGMGCLGCAQSAMRPLGETHKGLGLFGPLTLQWRGDRLHRWRR